jgi:hypothetical protein
MIFISLLKLGVLMFLMAQFRQLWFCASVPFARLARVQRLPLKTLLPEFNTMQVFTPLPDDQLLRSESSVPKFIRRIKQQLDLYELSDYAYLNQADYDLPYSIADLSKRRQASALIKQSITDEVLDKFPDEYTGRQIIRSMQETHESKPMDEPVEGNFTVATEGTFIASYTSRFESEYEMPVFRRPNVMRTLHPILPHQVAYVEASRARRNSGVEIREIQGSALRDMQHSGSISQGSVKGKSHFGSSSLGEMKHAGSIRQDMQRSGSISQGSFVMPYFKSSGHGSALQSMKHDGPISQESSADLQRSESFSQGLTSDIKSSKFVCQLDSCRKEYKGKRQFARHLIKHKEHKFRCTVEV